MQPQPIASKIPHPRQQSSSPQQQQPNQPTMHDQQRQKRERSNSATSLLLAGAGAGGVGGVPPSLQTFLPPPPPPPASSSPMHQYQQQQQPFGAPQTQQLPWGNQQQQQESNVMMTTSFPQYQQQQQQQNSMALQNQLNQQQQQQQEYFYQQQQHENEQEMMYIEATLAALNRLNSDDSYRDIRREQEVSATDALRILQEANACAERSCNNSSSSTITATAPTTYTFGSGGGGGPVVDVDGNYNGSNSRWRTVVSNILVNVSSALTEALQHQHQQVTATNSTASAVQFAAASAATADADIDADADVDADADTTASHRHSTSSSTSSSSGAADTTAVKSAISVVKTAVDSLLSERTLDHLTYMISHCDRQHQAHAVEWLTYAQHLSGVVCCSGSGSSAFSSAGGVSAAGTCIAGRVLQSRLRDVTMLALCVFSDCTPAAMVSISDPRSSDNKKKETPTDYAFMSEQQVVQHQAAATEGAGATRRTLRDVNLLHYVADAITFLLLNHLQSVSNPTAGNADSTCSSTAITAAAAAITLTGTASASASATTNTTIDRQLGITGPREALQLLTSVFRTLQQSATSWPLMDGRWTAATGEVLLSMFVRCLHGVIQALSTTTATLTPASAPTSSSLSSSYYHSIPPSVVGSNGFRLMFASDGMAESMLASSFLTSVIQCASALLAHHMDDQVAHSGSSNSSSSNSHLSSSSPRVVLCGAVVELIRVIAVDIRQSDVTPLIQCEASLRQLAHTAQHDGLIQIVNWMTDILYRGQ